MRSLLCACPPLIPMPSEFKETASSKKSAKKKGKPPATPASDKKVCADVL